MRKGFTLIEILITLTIIGFVVTIAAFSLREAQKSARDAKRKADLENISIGLELYRSDCGRYPAAITFGGALSGTGAGNCNGTYMSTLPADPQPTAHSYSYATNAGGSVFYLCASLETSPNPAVSVANCSACTGTCNWRVTRP